MTPAAPSATAAEPEGRSVADRLRYVPALDGLRGVAVALVVAYHLDVSAVPGGFLGVDLFFVLSGFLITTLLIQEHAATRRFDLVAFWLRRARRLLPALFLLIGAISLWVAQASPFQRDQLRWDIISALGYVANWRFIAADQSYFEQFAMPSPVIHLWSLAIEEQFYVLWPLVMLAMFTLVRKQAWGRAAVGGLLVAGIVASVVALGLTYDQFDPSAAYYATHTRAHELLVGSAGAAVLVRWKSAVSPIMASLLALGGATGIAAFAAFLSDASALYYFGGSLLFSLAALGLIASLACAPHTRISKLLGVRPLRWLGMISYGVYLWHWPIILWLTPETTQLSGIELGAVRVVVTLSVSSASFLLIEHPIRRGGFGRLRVTGKRLATGAIAGAMVLSAVTVVNTRGALPIPEFVSNNRELVVSEVAGATGAVGLIGDSVAMSLYPGLAYQAAAANRTVVAAAFPGCPVGVAQRVDGDGAPFPFMKRCPSAVVHGQTQMIERFDPGVVFWLSSSDQYDIRVDDTILQGGSREWEEAAFADWDEVLERITRRGARVVLILPLHWRGADPGHCAGTSALSAEDCMQPNLSTNSLRAEYMRWASGHKSDVTVVQPDTALCPAGRCPAALDGVVLRSDPLHFSQEGAIVAMRRLLTLVPGELWLRTE